MSTNDDLRDFPDVKAKLQQPSKQSAFDKQKSEAEAKRQREAAETAAVYADFVKSLGDEDGDNGTSRVFGGSGPRPTRGGFGGGNGPPKRHFGAPTLKSGPGSLGPTPGGFGKKRSFQDFARGGRERHNDDRPSSTIPKAFEESDDDEEMGGTNTRAEEKAVAKPTLRLMNLPPGISSLAIKALLPDDLKIENVKIQAPAGPGGSERKNTIAIVVLSQETPANEIDGVVSLLQNKYLGYGFYLSLHRHLSSAVSTSTPLPSYISSNSESQPFGAKPVETPPENSVRQTHQGFQKGFAPPTNYEPLTGNVNRSSLLHVPVNPPKDVRTLQLINKMIEGILEHGPEYEALLMSRPEVHREERWAWIWDARSEGGIWYRWRMWEIVTGIEAGRKGRYVPLFDGAHAWKTPEKRLPFEYATKIDEFISDSDYNSSDEEDLDGEEKRENPAEENEKSFLNPLEKAKLTHLLARLPKTISKLRKGDIARVTSFAIMHASRGVDEVVDMIISNIEQPFTLTKANTNRHQDSNNGEEAAAGEDASAASLVALYVVNDILSSSSTSGVRHAWRFRQLFEAALRNRKVFEVLGLMAEKHKWGRMRADKWKRSVGLVLNLWEGWCVFPADSQQVFASTFENPPSIKPEEKMEDSVQKGKWKTVEAGMADSTAETPGPPSQPPPAIEEMDGEPMDEEDIDGEPIDEEDIEGEPITDDDLDGEPMEEDAIVENPPGVNANDTGGEGGVDQVEKEGPSQEQQGGGLAQPRRSRMRAVDMFLDSDGSDNDR